MTNEKTFKTKSGYCQILPDKIVLTRTGIMGGMAKVVSGNNSLKPLLINTALALYFFYEAYRKYQLKQIGMTIFLVCSGLFFIFIVLKSLNNSAAPVIYRDKIKEVKFNKAVPGLRAYFIVWHENKQGKLKKRYIMLPGSLSGGPNETENGLRIMKEEGLI